MTIKKLFIFLLGLFLVFSCLKNNTGNETDTKSLTIFFVNDQHGQIENFSKIKHIVDSEEKVTNVILACSGDMFSGNPIVDNYPEKGYPMIDIMNQCGFDISVLGNHEFDYGESVLKNRMEQAEFDFICANVDMDDTGIPEPLEYKSIVVGDLKVTFLGLVETNGKADAIFPSTHPWKVQNLTFYKPESIVSEYSALKEQEDSDILIALSHLGHDGYYGNLGDFQLAEKYHWFDMIIGGHSHAELDTTINNIPIFQSGSNLNNLGKIELTIKNKQLESVNFHLIDLNTYPEYDQDLKKVIDDYYNSMFFLDDVIGYSHIYHSKSQVGCFYTEALRGILNTDITFQNTGGVRSELEEGDITKREIYEIAPFNNGTIIYRMTVSEIKNFLIGSASGFYYSGMNIVQIGSDIQITDLTGNILSDNEILSLGVNDYIPAVHDTYFPSTRNTQSLTTAETIISYLENIDNQVNYPSCSNYFRYQ